MPDEIKFLGGLLAAALSGLTFIAYKHPYNYRKLDRVLWAILVLFQTGIIVWNISVYNAEMAIIHLQINDVALMHKLIDVVDSQNLPIFYLVAISLSELYLFFIWSFPYWLLE